MAFLNKLFNKSEKQPVETEASEWDSLKDVPFEEKAPTAEQLSDKKDLDPTYRRIDGERAEYLLQNVESEGDPCTLHPGQEKCMLNGDFLRENGLEPKVEMTCEGVTLAFSAPFRVDEYDAMIGYTTNPDGKVIARSYYSSSKDRALWKMLPDYVRRENQHGDVVQEWFGKGYSEDALTMPIGFQEGMRRARNNMDEESGLDLPSDVAKFALFGTAQCYDSMDDYFNHINDGSLRNSIYGQVSREPKLSFGTISNEKKRPEDCLVTEGQMPDFSFETASWRIKVDANDADTRYQREGGYMGWVFQTQDIKCFTSNDGELRYMLCKRQYDQADIFKIETKDALTPSGLRSEWVEGGDLCTPVYTEKELADGYGDEKNTRANGTQVNMWEKYNSRIPMITQFYAKYIDKSVTPNNAVLEN